MLQLITASAITTLHQQSLINWDAKGLSFQHQGFFKLVEENHAFNYQLWRAEDRARRDDMGYEFVYHAKREIDHCNQQRNNRMEAMDEWMFKLFNPSPVNIRPVNSESPGMIIDRLSILSLKSYHMALQTMRTDVSEEHRIKCRDKLLVIQQQLEQLSLCFSQLLDDITNKNRTFRVYHQFKMYNDPTLNPELYSQMQE